MNLTVKLVRVDDTEYSLVMLVSLRPYHENEFKKSLEIRGISENHEIQIWKRRFEKSGAWDDHYLHLAIDLSGILVGDLQIRKCPQTMPNGVLELGIEIDPTKRGLGIGTQSLNLASQRFLGSEAHRLSGSTEVDNFAMIGAFEKAGWIREGILKGLFNKNGKLIDYVSYSKTI